MSAHSDEAYLKQRLELLELEKQRTRLSDEIAAKRRQLPQVEVKQAESYVFATRQGPRTLPQLFGSCSQLLVYHFMFGEEMEQGCTSCSFWMDGLQGTSAHLRARDATLVAVAQAPLEKLQKYCTRMAWEDFPMVSSHGSSFNKDFGVLLEDKDEEGKAYYNFKRQKFPMRHAPGISAFRKEGEKVFHSWSGFGRGLDHFNPAYALLDVLPKGRDEGELAFPMSWVKLHDKYDFARPRFGNVVAEVISNDAEKHIEWIKKVFEARCDFMAKDDKGKVMHGPCHFLGGEVYVADAAAQTLLYEAGAAGEKQRDNVCVHLNVFDADAVAARAKEHGAAFKEDVKVVPWGARYGRFRDPFGQLWAVYASLPSDPEEPAAKKSKH